MIQLSNHSGGAVPPTLYHYTSADALQSILTSGTIRATDIRFLNDAAEYRHSESVLARFVEAKRRGGVTKGQQWMIGEILGERANNRFTSDRRPEYVFALSEQPDLLSQWRSYCPPSGGFAIGFDTEALHAAWVTYSESGADVTKAHGDSAIRLGRCVYNPSAQLSCFDEPWNEAIACVREFDDGRVAGHVAGGARLAANAWRLAPFLKHEAFVDEREWRLALTTTRIAAPANGHITSFRPVNGRLVPFVSLKLEPFPVSEIWVGPSALQTLAAESLGEFLLTNNIPSVVRSGLRRYGSQTHPFVSASVKGCCFTSEAQLLERACRRVPNNRPVLPTLVSNSGSGTYSAGSRICRSPRDRLAPVVGLRFRNNTPVGRPANVPSEAVSSTR